jgi:hypothetical protein
MTTREYVSRLFESSNASVSASLILLNEIMNLGDVRDG